jgi:hypothetical protein
MSRILTVRRQRQVYIAIAVALLLGFVCQLLVLDRWMSPVEAAGTPHANVQFCHGSLSNCAGTVDVGSSLHAELTPPLQPEPHPGDVDLAVHVPPSLEPLVSDPPPRSL